MLCLGVRVMLLAAAWVHVEAVQHKDIMNREIQPTAEAAHHFHSEAEHRKDLQLSSGGDVRPVPQANPVSCP